MSTPMFPVPKEAASEGASETTWFAGLAMQSIIGKQSSLPDTPEEREEIALWSYRMAEAMVAMGKRLHAEEK